MKMNNILKDQLNLLKTLEFQVDGKPSKDFPESFSEVVFLRTTKQILDTSLKTIKFESYIVTPYEGFDFHDKFNKGIAPPEQVMQGFIIKETEKMYYLKVKSTSGKSWEGYCPKKSCKIL